jgi:hypothetical protein
MVPLAAEGDECTIHRDPSPLPRPPRYRAVTCFTRRAWESSDPLGLSRCTPCAEHSCRPGSEYSVKMERGNIFQSSNAGSEKADCIVLYTPGLADQGCLELKPQVS